MRVPVGWYQIVEELTGRFPALRPAQARGLATWVYGTVAADSGCEAAVVLALWADAAVRSPVAAPVSEATLRGVLREFLWDGADKASPCTTQVVVGTCFAPLLAWVLDWWTDGRHLPLAVDVTHQRDDLAVLAVSVLYRGSAIPVAWAVLPTTPKAPGQPKDRWAATFCTLLAALRPVVPARMQVLVLADQGLCSPRLRCQIRRLGWHPLMRLNAGAQVCPSGRSAFQPARTLVAAPGQAWVGRARIYTGTRTQVDATLLVVWDTDQQDVWVLLTDLRPRRIGVVWYALRMWIELGFRALKAMGWHYERTRRTHPSRVARHWLVLAVATLLTIATGTRAEDAARRHAPLATLTRPPGGPLSNAPRRHSVFARGRACLRLALQSGTVWTPLWLTPEPWLDHRPSLHVIRHRARLTARSP